MAATIYKYRITLTHEADAYDVNVQDVTVDNYQLLLTLGTIIKGDKGDDGDSAYQVAVNNGFVGTEQEWLASLKGDTGDPAGFGVVDAEADANVGTPSVDVTTSGPDTAKNIHFAFHNIKGEKGSDASVTEQNIERALGYVPVAPADIAGLKNIYSGTTAYWNGRTGYQPAAGDVIIYTDKATVDGKDVPGIKIGGGNGYVQDLAFVADDIAAQLLSHINDTTKHITSGERLSWNNKITIEDTTQEVTNETLIFTRN